MPILRSGIKLAAPLLLAAIPACGLFSQEPPASPSSVSAQPPAPRGQASAPQSKSEVSVQDTPNAFKVRVNLVQVHVVVRDGAGKPVAGLRKEDFQLYDNNKLQTITAFGIEDAASRAQLTEAAKTQLNNGEPIAPAAETVPDRFIALTFDDVHLETGDVAPMRLAANAFIDSLAASDRVGFFTTSGVVTQDFTSNKELLKQALLKVMSRAHTGTSGGCPDVSYDMALEVKKGGDATISVTAGGAPDLSLNAAFAILYERTLACAPGITPSAAAALVSAVVDEVFEEGNAETRNVYRELEGELRVLSSKPGERVLLLVSPGFLLAEFQQRSELAQFVDHANQSNIVINAMDARGLYTADLFGDIAQPYAQPAQMAGQATGILLRVQTEKQFVLTDFADDTGGRFFHNSNALAGGLKQLGTAPDISYILGFSPSLLKTDGKFHTLKVILAAKQKYAIQARRGYFAPNKLEDPAEIAKEEIREAVFSPDEVVSLPFTMQTQYFKSSPTAAQLTVVAHVDLNGVPFRKADGRACDDVTVATVIFDENGNFIAGGERLEQLRLLDATLEKVSRTGIFLKSATYEVKPGKYLVRQVVRESEGSQLSARSGLVVIPE